MHRTTTLPHRILFTLILFFCSHYCYAQKAINNTLRLDSLAKQAAKTIVAHIRESKDDSVFITITPHPADYLLRDAIYNEVGANIILSEKAKSRCSVSILDYGVRYSAYKPNSDSLLREVTFIGSGTVITNSGSSSPIPHISVSLKDIISRSSISAIENPNVPFTQSVPPPEETTFWKEIAEPVIFISSAALTVFLLFSVRSN